MQWRWSPPAAVAARMIDAVTGGEGAGAGESPPPTFPLKDFQDDAVRRARLALRRRGGVVIADEVGLGKTYVALALAEDALRAGEDVGILVPAALVPTWKPLIRRVARCLGRAAGTRLETHARLSRGTHAAEWLRGAALIVVDEAHAFRNPATRRYRALADVCRGAVVLITATPVNNSIQDLYHLIRLFAADHAFRDVGVVSLREAFESGADGSAEVRRLLPQVVIRRTRALLGPGPERGFPRRAPPEVLRYEDPLVAELVAGIESLGLAPYAGRADALCRLGLLKRLESGRPALAASLRRLGRLLSAFADAAAAGRLLRPGDPLLDAGSDDAEQLFLAGVVLDEAPPGLDLPALARSARRDLEEVRRLTTLLRGPDPKLEALCSWARDRQDPKAVIFTEHRDTAAAVWRALAPAAPVGRVDGGGAWLGLAPSRRRAVVERFAPRANGVADPPRRERVDLLVATDVLAEGLNLQDASGVVCYDLPWNPVRLLQRIGRVDRLGSPHAEVRPYLFLPATGLDAVLRLTRLLRRKLGGIEATLGPEAVLDLLEQLGRGRNPSTGPLAEAPDPWERLRRLRVGSDVAGGAADGVGPVGAARSPMAAVLDGGPAAGAAWLVLVEGAGAGWLLEVDPDGRAAPAGPRTLNALEVAMRAGPRVGTGAAEGAAAAAGPVQAREPPEGAFRRELDAVERAVARHLGGQRALAMAPAAIRRGDPGARAARRLRAALLDAGPVPPPGLLHRADRILIALAEPLTPATERRLARLLATSPPGEGIAGLLDRLEPLTDAVPAAPRVRPERKRGAADGGARGPSRVSGTRVVAALRIAAAGSPGGAPAGGPRGRAPTG